MSGRLGSPAASSSRTGRRRGDGWAVSPWAWVASAVAGLATGVVGSFQQGWEVTLGGVRVPLGSALGVVVVVAVVAASGQATRSRVGALLAFTSWILTVLVLTLPRPEGDLVVPGTAGGYLWLFGGTMLGAAALAWPYGQPRPSRLDTS